MPQTRVCCMYVARPPVDVKGLAEMTASNGRGRGTNGCQTICGCTAAVVKWQLPGTTVSDNNKST
jgi:hypothetical protein